MTNNLNNKFVVISEDSGDRMSLPNRGGPTQMDDARRSQVDASSQSASILPKVLSLPPVDQQMLMRRLISTGHDAIRNIMQPDPDALGGPLSVMRQRSAPKPIREELLVRPDKAINHH